MQNEGKISPYTELITRSFVSSSASLLDFSTTTSTTILTSDSSVVHIEIVGITRRSFLPKGTLTLAIATRVVTGRTINHYTDRSLLSPTVHAS